MVHVPPSGPLSERAAPHRSRLTSLPGASRADRQAAILLFQSFASIHSPPGTIVAGSSQPHRSWRPRVPRHRNRTGAAQLMRNGAPSVVVASDEGRKVGSKESDLASEPHV